MPETIAAILQELRQLDYQSLACMPASQSRDLVTDKSTVIVTTWVDRIGEGILRVVVQTYDRRGGMMGKMSADGFRINSRSEITPLISPEIYQFL